MRRAIFLVLALLSLGYLVYVGDYTINKRGLLATPTTDTPEIVDNDTNGTDTFSSSTSSLSAEVSDPPQVINYASLGLMSDAYVDKKEKFSIHLPEGWETSDVNIGKDGRIFSARSQKNDINSGAIQIVKEYTSYTEDTIISASPKDLHSVAKILDVQIDEVITLGDKKIRSIEGIDVIGGKEFRRLTIFYVKNGQLYLVNGLILSTYWESSKENIKASLSSFVLE